jgi:hypothetical protein
MAPRGIFARLGCAGCLGLATVALVDCVDATHDDQVQARGGEAPGVPTGPEHRPGQPCLVCHGGQGPASTSFSIGGTIYALPMQPAPAVGAQVQVEDIAGAAFVLPTNPAGNFYVTSAQWQPAFPIKMQVTLGSSTQQMLTSAGRDGSCAACHFGSPGPNTPGPIYAANSASALPDAGGSTQ